MSISISKFFSSPPVQTRDLEADVACVLPLPGLHVGLPLVVVHSLHLHPAPARVKLPMDKSYDLSFTNQRPVFRSRDMF